MAYVLGCDPGVEGSLVLIDDRTCDVLAVLDTPIVRAGKQAWIDGGILGEWLVNKPIDLAVVELVHTWAGNAKVGNDKPQSAMAASIGTLMRLAGGVEALLSSLGIPVEHSTASVWKRRAGLLKRPKEASVALARARLAWPSGALSLAKHHGRAEAALIALFGRAPERPASAPKRSKKVDQTMAENVPPGEPFQAPGRPCWNCGDTSERTPGNTPTCTRCGVPDNAARHYPVPPAQAQLERELAAPAPPPAPARAQLERALAQLPSALRLPNLKIQARGRRKAKA